MLLLPTGTWIYCPPLALALFTVVKLPVRVPISASRANPGQVVNGVGVMVGVAVAVFVGGGVAVSVDVCVAVGVSVSVGDAVSVMVGVADSI